MFQYLVLFSVCTLETLGRGIQPQGMEICMYHDCSRLKLAQYRWSYNTFIYVCVDSSQTVLEHHRPFHSHVSLILCDKRFFFLLHFQCSYRHMGVIGAVMVIRQLAESSAAFDMNRTVASQHSTTSGSTGLSPARRRKVTLSLSLSHTHTYTHNI